MRIKLTQDKFAIVDKIDFEYLNQFKWCYHRGYAIRSSPMVNGKRKHILMHRVILERTGHTDFRESDHINRDTLNNRRCNLRPATTSQNSWNTGKPKTNTSGFKGISWFKHDKKWCARITVDGSRIYLGLYDTKKQAAHAYNVAARKYHGEFACLNVL